MIPKMRDDFSSYTHYIDTPLYQRDVNLILNMLCMWSYPMIIFHKKYILNKLFKFF